MGAVWCGAGVAMLCWGSEGEKGRVWLRCERVTHGVHDVAVEGDVSQASRQGYRGGVGVSAKLRGDRRASEESGASWGAVVEKSGGGVHARPEHGELRHGNRGVRRCCAARSVSSCLTGAVRDEVTEDAERGQWLLSSTRFPRRRGQCGGVRTSSTVTASEPNCTLPPCSDGSVK